MSRKRTHEDFLLTLNDTVNKDDMYEEKKESSEIENPSEKKKKKKSLQSAPNVKNIADLIDIVKNIKFYKNIDTIMLWRITSVLEELYNMIGMKSLKETVFYQLLYYIQGMNIKNKNDDYLHTVIYGQPGTGKCLAYDTEVYMYNGGLKKVQDIVAGDLLMGSDGTSRTVKKTFLGHGNLYDVYQNPHFSNGLTGITYRVNTYHVLSLVLVMAPYFKDNIEEKKYTIYYCDLFDTKTISFAYSDGNKKEVYDNCEHFIKHCPQVGFILDIPLSMYLYDRSERWRKCFRGYRAYVDFPERKIPVDPYILGCWLGSNLHETQLAYYTSLSLQEYKYNTIQTRTELISGLADSCLSDMIKLPTDVTQDILWILDSLGIVYTKIGDSYKLIGNTDILKTDKPIPNQIIPQFFKLRIEKVEKGNYYGFSLTGDKRFLLKDFTVTHNSTVANILGRIYQGLNILSQDGSFKIARRDDLIAGYLGQTAIKTRNFLESCIGGVLLIDEAYALAPKQNDRDSFSKEALDTLNAFLSEHKNDFCCIIAGYEEEIQGCFFNMNIGLKRRFPWIHRIDAYNAEEMARIFLKMISNINWVADFSVYFLETEIFRDKELFSHAGGDIENLLTKCKLCHSRRVFGLKDRFKFILTEDDIKAGLKMHTTSKQKEDENTGYMSMYI